LPYIDASIKLSIDQLFIQTIAHIEQLAPLVETTMRADPVRHHALVTIGAFDQVWYANCVMCTATIATTLT
jgi:hypothetical protein